MVMYLCVWGVDFASIIDFSIGIWKCSVSVVIFVFNFIYAFMMEAFFRKYSTEGSFSSPQL
jgi:hypothetical protein